MGVGFEKMAANKATVHAHTPQPNQARLNQPPIRAHLRGHVGQLQQDVADGLAAG